MGNHERKSGIILILAIIAVVIALIIYLLNSTYKVAQVIAKGGEIDSVSQDENYIANNVGEISNSTPVNTIPLKNIIKVYSITYNTESNKEKKYTLDNDFSIDYTLNVLNTPQLTFTVNNGYYEFKDDLIVDDEKIEGNKRNGTFKYNYYRVGDYLCFTNHNNPDLENAHLYVVEKDGNLYQDIHFLDTSKGMKAEKIDFTSDRIIIHTTGVSNNKIVKATYSYIVREDGNINFDEPEIDYE